jgi:hypothetical protein
MQTACSACGGPLQESGVYSLSLSLRPDAPKRWRTVALACSLSCLAEVVTQMQDGALRRQHDHVAAVMSARPRGR